MKTTPPSSPPPRLATGRARALAWGLALVVALGSPACRFHETDGAVAATAPAPRPPNLVLLTLDTLRADHLGAYGYFRDTSPHLDRLAAGSVVFERAYAPVAQTLPSHVSLFTGTYPLEHGITANVSQSGGLYRPSPKLRTLAQVLAEQGYRTAAFVSAEPVKRGSGAEQGFAEWHQPEDKTLAAGPRTDEVLEWLAAAPDEPFFLWVHYFDPHGPYRPPPPFDGMYATDTALEEHVAELAIAEIGSKAGKVPKARRSRPEINAYDGEIRYMDEHLGRLLAALEALEGWADTVVVVTADHGEALGQHGLVGHGHIWLEQLHVPLFVRAPGEAPRREEAALSSAALIPLLHRLAPALPLASLVDQATVRAPGDGGAADPLLSHRPSSKRQVTAILDLGWRLVDGLEGGPRLFDLASDPHELTDLAHREPARARELAAELDRRLRQQRRRGRDNEAGELIPAEGSDMKAKLDNLKALGYL